MKLVAFHRPASILCAVGGTWIWFRHRWEGESVTILSRVDLGTVECNAADLGAFSEPPARFDPIDVCAKMVGIQHIKPVN